MSEHRIASTAQNIKGYRDNARLRLTKWQNVKNNIILPALREAVEVIELQGMSAYAEEFQGNGHDLVQLWNGHDSTGFSNGDAVIIQYSASMTYEVDFNGMILNWFFPHSLNRQQQRVELWRTAEPEQITQDSVLDDVVKFLEKAWESSVFHSQGPGPVRPGFMVNR